MDRPSYCVERQFIGSNWTVEQIKKKYNSLKQRAKGKFDLAKSRGQTGGGPCPAALSAAEETLLRNVDGRPFLEGLDCGIDTDEAVESPSRTSRPLKTAKQVQSSSTIRKKISRLNIDTDREEPASRQSEIISWNRKVETGN